MDLKLGLRKKNVLVYFQKLTYKYLKFKQKTYL